MRKRSNYINMHETSTRSLFVHALRMTESRSSCLVRLPSIFCNKNKFEAGTREQNMDPAFFQPCANVALVNILSIIAFFINFIESQYATFTMVRAPHPFSDAIILLFL